MFIVALTLEQYVMSQEDIEREKRTFAHVPRAIEWHVLCVSRDSVTFNAEHRPYATRSSLTLPGQLGRSTRRRGICLELAQRIAPKGDTRCVWVCLSGLLLAVKVKHTHILPNNHSTGINVYRAETQLCGDTKGATGICVVATQMTRMLSGFICFAQTPRRRREVVPRGFIKVWFGYTPQPPSVNNSNKKKT